MITLVCFTSSLTILLLSAKMYKDLQAKIAEAEALAQDLRKKSKETTADNTIDAEIIEEDELI